MKKHDVKTLASAEGGEYVLGLHDLGTHACYLIYGELAPGEKGRKVCPGRGHEEILMAVKGDLDVTGQEYNGVIREGEAVHFKEDEACEIGNSGEDVAVYVMAGGHSGKPH